MPSSAPCRFTSIPKWSTPRQWFRGLCAARRGDVYYSTATGSDRNLPGTHIASEVTAWDQMGNLAGCPELTRKPEWKSPARGRVPR